MGGDCYLADEILKPSNSISLVDYDTIFWQHGEFLWGCLQLIKHNTLGLSSLSRHRSLPVLQEQWPLVTFQIGARLEWIKFPVIRSWRSSFLQQLVAPGPEPHMPKGGKRCIFCASISLLQILLPQMPFNFRKRDYFRKSFMTVCSLDIYSLEWSCRYLLFNFSYCCTSSFITNHKI